MKEQPHSHRCPAPGCTQSVPSALLACARHWYQVPRHIRDRVWQHMAAKRCGVPGADIEHRRAAREAIASLRAQSQNRGGTL